MLGRHPAVKTGRGERRRSDDEHSQIQGPGVSQSCSSATWSTPFPGRISIRPVLVHPALGLGPAVHRPEAEDPLSHHGPDWRWKKQLRRENLAEEHADPVCGHDPAKGKADFGRRACTARKSACQKLTAAGGLSRRCRRWWRRAKCFGDWMLTAAAVPPGGRASAGYGRGDGRRPVYRRYRPMAGVHP